VEQTLKYAIDHADSPVQNTSCLIASIRHHVPGRIRIKVSRAARNDAALNQIRNLICRIPSVTHYGCNALTGSIVIYYDHGTVKDILSEIEKKCGRISKLLRVKWARDAGPGCIRTKNSALYPDRRFDFGNLIGVVRDLDRGLRSATADLVDLRLLIATGIRLLT
jgi:hypothetical protein